MSYILEALKKSERERQRDEVPGFQADHSLPPLRRTGRQFSLWFFLGAVAFILLFAGALLWWQFGVDKTIQPVVVETLVISPEQIVSSASEATDLTTEKVASATVINKNAIIEKQDTSLAEEEAFVVPLLDELPVAIRAAIPDLSFAGHVYSDAPRKRLIIINSRIVREGDLIGNSLFLEKIDREGVVLRYDTFIFRVKLF